MNISLPNDMEIITGYMFYECANLNEIVIPDNVTTIGNAAFSGCTSLASITIKNPECVIYDDKYTISSEATIYGYANSTAQTYAEKYNRTFIEIT